MSCAPASLRYTPQGSEGLLKGKHAAVLAARGGRHEGTALDTQTGYIRDVLRFVGIDDVEFVYAEGPALGEAARAATLARAYAAIDGLVAEPLAA